MISKTFSLDFSSKVRGKGKSKKIIVENLRESFSSSSSITDDGTVEKLKEKDTATRLVEVTDSNEGEVVIKPPKKKKKVKKIVDDKEPKGPMRPFQSVSGFFDFTGDHLMERKWKPILPYLY